MTKRFKGQNHSGSFKESIGIGQQQPIDGEVAANGYQSVVLAQMWVGKPEVVV